MHSKEREQITHVCLHKAVRRQPLNIRQPGSEKGPLLVSAMGGTSVISHKGKAPWWLCTVLWSLGREREAAGICGTLVTVSLAACNNSALQLLTDSEISVVSPFYPSFSA